MDARDLKVWREGFEAGHESRFADMLSWLAVGTLCGLCWRWLLQLAQAVLP